MIIIVLKKFINFDLNILFINIYAKFKVHLLGIVSMYKSGFKSQPTSPKMSIIVYENLTFLI